MGDSERNERVAVNYTVDLSQASSVKEGGQTGGSALEPVPSPETQALQRGRVRSRVKNILTVIIMMVIIASLAATVGVSFFILHKYHKVLGAKAIVAAVGIALIMGALAVALAIKGVSIILRSEELENEVVRESIEGDQVQPSLIMESVDLETEISEPDIEGDQAQPLLYDKDLIDLHTELDPIPTPEPMRHEQGAMPGIVAVAKLSEEFPGAMRARRAYPRDSGVDSSKQTGTTASAPSTSRSSRRRSISSSDTGDNIAPSAVAISAGVQQGVSSAAEHEGRPSSSQSRVQESTVVSSIPDAVRGNNTASGTPVTAGVSDDTVRGESRHVLCPRRDSSEGSATVAQDSATTSTVLRGSRESMDTFSSQGAIPKNHVRIRSPDTSTGSSNVSATSSQADSTVPSPDVVKGEVQLTKDTEHNERRRAP